MVLEKMFIKVKMEGVKKKQEIALKKRGVNISERIF